jgi:hypothetical protein
VTSYSTDDPNPAGTPDDEVNRTDLGPVGAEPAGALPRRAVTILVSVAAAFIALIILVVIIADVTGGNTSHAGTIYFGRGLHGVRIVHKQSSFSLSADATFAWSAVLNQPAGFHRLTSRLIRTGSRDTTVALAHIRVSNVTFTKLARKVPLTTLAKGGIGKGTYRMTISHHNHVLAQGTFQLAR